MPKKILRYLPWFSFGRCETPNNQILGHLENVELMQCFAERAYLEANPDEPISLLSGQSGSGYQHYETHGRIEKRPPRNRTDATMGRVIITGTGRAGTTLLVQLLTALRFDTGFSLKQVQEDIDSISNAGLERVRIEDDSPYVVKSPWLADSLLDDLRDGRVKIKQAIIPIRDLVAAAESRRRVHFEAIRQGHDPNLRPGGLWHTANPEAQEAVLATQFYKAVYALVRFDIPIIFLEFPRFAQDCKYALQRLSSFLNVHGVSDDEFRDAFAGIVQVNRITIFS
jgi:hypothetical protein